MQRKGVLTKNTFGGDFISSSTNCLRHASVACEGYCTIASSHVVRLTSTRKVSHTGWSFFISFTAVVASENVIFPFNRSFNTFILSSSYSA